MPRGQVGGEMVQLAQAVDDAEMALRTMRSHIANLERRLEEAKRQVPEKEQEYAAAKKALRDALPPDPDTDAHSAFDEVRMDSSEVTKVRIIPAGPGRFA